MTAINKKVLAEIIAEEHDLTKKEATSIIDLVFDTITETLKKGDKVEITGFGKFEAKKRAAREGVNPATGAKIKIAACKAPAFKAGKALKDAIN